MFAVQKNSDGSLVVTVRKVDDFSLAFSLNDEAHWLREIRRYNKLSEMYTEFAIDEIEYFAFVAEQLLLAFESR